MRRVEQRGCGFPTQAGVLLLTVLATLSFADSDSHSPPLLSTDLIVQKLMAANAQRSQALRGYSGKRVYHLDYHGIFGSHDAGMQVEATYTAPNRKEFKIVSESGSKLLINHVLLKLLSSEQEAQEEQNRKELEISPRNYDFSLVGTEHTQDRDFYVLAVKPKGSRNIFIAGKCGLTPRISPLPACKASPPGIHLSGSATPKSSTVGTRLESSGSPSTTSLKPRFAWEAKPS